MLDLIVFGASAVFHDTGCILVAPAKSINITFVQINDVVISWFMVVADGAEQQC